MTVPGIGRLGTAESRPAYSVSFGPRAVTESEALKKKGSRTFLF